MDICLDKDDICVIRAICVICIKHVLCSSEITKKYNGNVFIEYF